MNEMIRDREIRVIDADGSQLGIMSSRDALRLAQEKKLDLEGQGSLSDLIEKESALGGLFEETFPGGHCAGERSPGVAKQFRFQQAFRDGATIDSYEGSLSSGAEDVERSGHQFLARSGLSRD